MLRSYSHNSLGIFRNCPRQFKFQYLQKVEVPKRLQAHTYLGNVVHRQLRKLHEWAANGKLLPLEELLKGYLQEWEKPAARNVVITVEHMTVDDYIDNGRKMLTEYYETYQPFDRGKHLGAELRISFELPRTRFRFQAVIDRLWRRNDGTVEICDYKTGRLPAQGVNDGTLHRQMGLYQLAVQSNFPHFDSIELAQYFLKHGEVLLYRMRPDELDQLTEQFRVEVRQSINAEMADDFPTRESALCNFCDYFSLCPAKRHRLILEDETAADSDEKTTMQSAAELADRFIEMDRHLKEIRQEHEALKEEIASTARELSLEKLSGSTADVSVRATQEDKLITKTEDSDKFAELSRLVRQWELQECFSLDNNYLMKEIYQKERLNEDQHRQLEEFIIRKERRSVRVVKKREPDDE
jgi:RecB family exonuclease